MARPDLKDAARRHLAGVVVQYVLDGGDVGKLLGDSVLERNYEILRQALQAAGWPEAAGRVQDHIERRRANLSKVGVPR